MSEPVPVVAKYIHSAIYRADGRVLIEAGTVFSKNVVIPEELGGRSVWRWALANQADVLTAPPE